MQPLMLTHVLPIVVIGALLATGIAWLVISADRPTNAEQEWVSEFPFIREHLHLNDSKTYTSIYVGEQGEFARETGTWSMNSGTIELNPDSPKKAVRWLKSYIKFGCKGLRAVDANGVATKTKYEFFFRPGTC